MLMYIYIYTHTVCTNFNIGVRGSPAQDISSLGTMGQGLADLQDCSSFGACAFWWTPQLLQYVSKDFERAQGLVMISEEFVILVRFSSIVRDSGKCIIDIEHFVLLILHLHPIYVF